MSNLTNEELVQMFNNAWKTYAECRGNHKELKLRGIEIERNLQEGVYNGKGSY